MHYALMSESLSEQCLDVWIELSRVSRRDVWTLSTHSCFVFLKGECDVGMQSLNDTITEDILYVEERVCNLQLPVRTPLRVASVLCLNLTMQKKLRLCMTTVINL